MARTRKRAAWLVTLQALGFAALSGAAESAYEALMVGDVDLDRVFRMALVGGLAGVVGLLRRSPYQDISEAELAEMREAARRAMEPAE